jgi:hypothetical protein
MQIPQSEFVGDGGSARNPAKLRPGSAPFACAANGPKGVRHKNVAQLGRFRGLSPVEPGASYTALRPFPYRVRRSESFSKMPNITPTDEITVSPILRISPFHWMCASDRQRPQFTMVDIKERQVKPWAVGLSGILASVLAATSTGSAETITVTAGAWAVDSARDSAAPEPWDRERTILERQKGAFFRFKSPIKPGRLRLL